MDREDYELDNHLAASLTMLVVAALGLVVLLWWVTSAPASAVCLTKAEARALWPNLHLYWYSQNHCWSNRHGPPSGLRLDKLRSRAEEVRPETGKSSEKHDMSPRPRRAGGVVKVVRWEDYNEIDAMADSDPFFEAKPLQFWPSVAPFIPWQERIAGPQRGGE